MNISNKIAFLFFISIFIPYITFASTESFIERAKVLEVSNQQTNTVYGTNSKIIEQELSVEILSGNNKGKEIYLYNDYIVLKEGDRFFISEELLDNGEIHYKVVEKDRRFLLALFILFFVGIILFFGKKQGARSLLSLLGSIFLIAYGLIPSLLKGYNPLFISVGISVLILFFAIYFTHGFKKTSTIAFAGTIIAICITGLFSFVASSVLGFSGFGSEEATFLSLKTTSDIDFSGLLLGGIIVGVLGVLDDIAITQVAVVREFYSVGNISKKDIYKKAISVGQEHVGALVNTLALAYTGASLPLLLLLSMSSAPLSVLVSQEQFSVEIIRTIVGSIGLVLTVPITTLLAVYFLEKDKHSKGSVCTHSHIH